VFLSQWAGSQFRLSVSVFLSAVRPRNQAQVGVSRRDAMVSIEIGLGSRAGSYDAIIQDFGQCRPMVFRGVSVLARTGPLLFPMQESRARCMSMREIHAAWLSKRKIRRVEAGFVVTDAYLKLLSLGWNAFTGRQTVILSPGQPLCKTLAKPLHNVTLHLR